MRSFEAPGSGDLRNYAQAALLTAECHKRGLKL